jgi:hypothetical protein
MSAPFSNIAIASRFIQLLDVTADSWRVDAIRVAKSNFDRWYEEARRKVQRR